MAHSAARKPIHQIFVELADAIGALKDPCIAKDVLNGQLAECIRYLERFGSDPAAFMRTTTERKREALKRALERTAPVVRIKSDGHLLTELCRYKNVLRKIRMAPTDEATLATIRTFSRHMASSLRSLGA